jgi:hypothetical protein
MLKFRNINEPQKLQSEIPYGWVGYIIHKHVCSETFIICEIIYTYLFLALYSSTEEERNSEELLYSVPGPAVDNFRKTVV